MKNILVFPTWEAATEHMEAFITPVIRGYQPKKGGPALPIPPVGGTGESGKADEAKK